MLSVPSFERLRAELGGSFRLVATSGEAFTATLQAATPGVPMSPHYCCYAALFALLPGVHLPQAVYRVESGPDAWPLLLTPARPGSDGHALLEAVFHYPTPQTHAGLP
jgi:hypothetical protein